MDQGIAQTMVQESPQGAYLGPGPGLQAVACEVAITPHFHVFDGNDQRLILGKCSRLPDDEDQAAGRFGIDFHRALPPFKGDSGFSCAWGAGQVVVNAYNYARYLPQALKFREFTANLAFAAWTPEEYQAKCRVYQEFYHHLYHSGAHCLLATPHSGEVYRAPDEYHPFPQSEIDAWTARVAARLICRQNRLRQRILISLHSTDYFGTLFDIGDFGLPQNDSLPRVLKVLREHFSEAISAILPAYREHIIPYTRARLKWFAENWGTLDPQRLAAISTAARFEVLSLARMMGDCLDPREPFTFSGLVKGLEGYWSQPAGQFITLNGIFSGRKTARLLNLSANLHRAGIHTAVQVECSRFLARHYPHLAAEFIMALRENLAGLL